MKPAIASCTRSRGTRTTISAPPCPRRAPPSAARRRSRRARGSAARPAAAPSRARRRRRRAGAGRPGSARGGQAWGRRAPRGCPAPVLDGGRRLVQRSSRPRPSTGRARRRRRAVTSSPFGPRSRPRLGEADHARDDERERGAGRVRGRPPPRAGARGTAGGATAPASAAAARTRSAARPALWGATRGSDPSGQTSSWLLTFSSSFFRARDSRVEHGRRADAEHRAVSSPSRSSRTRSATTSRSPALSYASAASSSGDSPSAKRGSCCASGGDRAFAPPPALLGAEPVERGRAGDVQQPGARGAAARVEARPEPQRLLEGLAREILGERAVACQVEQVAVHVVQVLLRDGCEGRPRRRAAAAVRVIVCTSSVRRRTRMRHIRVSPAGPDLSTSLQRMRDMFARALDVARPPPLPWTSSSSIAHGGNA